MITIAGLPAHPLLVHAAVVLIPLAALGSLAIAVRAAWRRSYAPLVAIGAVAASLAATGAKLAGDQLYAALSASGSLGAGIDQHGQWGQYTMFASWPYAVLALIAAVLARRSRVPAHARAGDTIVATGVGIVTFSWLAALAGIATTALVVLTGDSGSRAVWGFVTGG
jgi:hypothetical protein